ncbi:MAG TPA: hypothetical protein VLK58_05120, partial [Conexibacter sp.]|nr:hypothetical protein [Conexibacter sp.]
DPDPRAAGRLLSVDELRRERDALIEEVELRASAPASERPAVDASPAAAETRSSATRPHGAKLRWRPA